MTASASSCHFLRVVGDWVQLLSFLMRKGTLGAPWMALCLLSIHRKGSSRTLGRTNMATNMANLATECMIGQKHQLDVEFTTLGTFEGQLSG